MSCALFVNVNVSCRVLVIYAWDISAWFGLFVHGLVESGLFVLLYFLCDIFLPYMIRSKCVEYTTHNRMSTMVDVQNSRSVHVDSISQSTSTHSMDTCSDFALAPHTIVNRPG
eukprot:125463_1